MKELWKTTIVIWSDWDPNSTTLVGLASEAEKGDAYCAYTHSELVDIDSIPTDPHWDNTEFFDRGKE